MSTRFKILAGISLFLVALVIILESQEPSPLNWFPSYSKTATIPYGTKVLHTTLSQSLEKERFKEITTPPFEFLSDSTSQAKGTYIFINSSVKFDNAEADKLLEWVAQGNQLYIAGQGIGDRLLDTLGLETESYYELENFEHKPLVKLVHPAFQDQKPYLLDIETSTRYFEKIDTLNTVVLGTYDLQRKNTPDDLLAKPKVHFIKQAFGDGEIVIHLFPEAYTNYFILKDNNATYVQNTLRYLNTDDNVYWDNHYKNGKTFYTSPLYLLLTNRYLKWAYYMLIIGTILWVIFEGKRKQRAIPIIRPLPNQTLAFTKTIAGLYLERKDHKSIATHAVNHFFEWLRSEYQLQTDTLGLQFIQRAAAKTTNTVESTKQLLDYIRNVQESSSITQEQLLRLNTLINNYKNTAYGDQ